MSRTSDKELASRRCSVGSEGAGGQLYRHDTSANQAPSETQSYQTMRRCNQQFSYPTPLMNVNNNVNTIFLSQSTGVFIYNLFQLKLKTNMTVLI